MTKLLKQEHTLDELLLKEGVEKDIFITLDRKQQSDLFNEDTILYKIIQENNVFNILIVKETGKIFKAENNQDKIIDVNDKHLNNISLFTINNEYIISSSVKGELITNKYLYPL